MHSRISFGERAGIRVVDLFVLALSLPLAYAIYQHVHAPPWVPPLEDLGMPLVLVLVTWGVASWLARVYEPSAPARAAGERMRVLFAMALVTVGAAALAFVGQREISRLLMALYVATATTLLLLVRSAVRAFAHATRRGYNARRFAVVGTGELAREIVEAIGTHPELGMSFAGYVALDHPEDPRPASPALCRLSELGRVLEEQVLDQVIFALPRERMAAMEPAILLCEEQGVDVQISLDVLRYGRARLMLGELDGLPMLALRRTPTDTVALAVKRIYDVVVSAAVMVLLAPVFVGVAAAIKLDSRGPVFFRQRRVGLNGRVFEMLKFRSMCTDAEARLAALKASNEMSGPVFKMTNDPRVTRVGRFLRRTSLDEFPQFWNVLRGEMSVVGPRPPIPAEVREYKRWHRRRLSMKPGITCIWQISGRNQIDFDRWMELDLEYIDHWSLWQDLRICVLTVPAVLSSRGAH